MNIDFGEIKETHEKNFKGGEKELVSSIYDDGNAKIMKCVLVPGASIGYHKHDTNSEIMYFLEGDATVCLDGDTVVLRSGCAHYCPQGHSHSVKNNGKTDLVFFAVVK